jgi:hypothetical protein
MNSTIHAMRLDWQLCCYIAVVDVFRMWKVNLAEIVYLQLCLTALFPLYFILCRLSFSSCCQRVYVVLQSLWSFNKSRNPMEGSLAKVAVPTPVPVTPRIPPSELSQTRFARPQTIPGFTVKPRVKVRSLYWSWVKFPVAKARSGT